MAYQGTSIVDYIKSIGGASDYGSRSALAAKSGINNYTGSAAQNTSLLNTLRTSASPGATATTPTSITTPQTKPQQNTQGSMNQGQTQTGTSTGKPQKTSYDLALNSYLDALQGSNRANQTVDKASIAARRGYLDTLDAPGGLKQGAQESASLFNRNASNNLADLGVAQNAATNASQVALERLKYEQGLLPKPGEAFNLSPGQARFDPTGKQIAALPDTPSLTEQYGSGAIGEYNFAKANGYTGSFTQYQNEDANRKARITSGGTGGNGDTDKTNAKGSLGAKQFVELSLQRSGVTYDQALKQIPPGKVGVVNNKTGEVGFIDPLEFTTSKYTYL